MEKDSRYFCLTTTDNIYNPFTHWTEWYMEDLRLGYDTLGLLARVATIGEVFKEDERQAMRAIVESNLSGKHVMIAKEEFDSVIGVLHK